MKNPRMNTSEIAEILIAELAKLEQCAKVIKEAVDKAEQIRFPVDTSNLEQTAKQMKDTLDYYYHDEVRIRYRVFQWVLCVVLGLVAALSLSSTVFYYRWKEAVGVERGEVKDILPPEEEIK